MKVEGNKIHKSIVAYIYRKTNAGKIDNIKVLTIEDLRNNALSSFSNISF